MPVALAQASSFVSSLSHSRMLGAQLGVGIATDEDRRMAELLQTLKGIMDWIAMPNFLKRICTMHWLDGQRSAGIRFTRRHR